MKLKRRKGIMLLAACFFLLTSTLIPKSKVQAAGDYYLQVNKGTNVVTVFRNDGTPVHAFVCSVGWATPIGTFNTSQKLRWHVLDGPSYGQYCTRITGSILFHSVWYYENGNLASQSYREYNKLGTTASHGCVRLTVADAKWIYDNCPLSTTVVIINGSAANDPLGKPQAMKVDGSQKMGWDPTDPAPGNPYGNTAPRIVIGNVNTNIEYGSNFQPFAGIAAYDSLGNDISGSLTYSGSVNTRKLGSYNIVYSVTDSLGRSASAGVTYKVVDDQKAIITGVKKTVTKEYNSAYNLKSRIKARTVDGKSLTSKIKVKIIYPGSKSERTYTKSTLKLTKLGTYKINYYVTNPNNKKVTKASCKLVVKDTKPPRLTGVSSKKTLEYASVKNLRSGVRAKLVSGKNLTSSIKVQVRAPGSDSYRTLSKSSSEKYRFQKTGTYKVLYTSVNPYNKKAAVKRTMTVTVKDTKAPVISGVSREKKLEYDTAVNLKSAISAKLVSGTDISSRMVITIVTPDNRTEKYNGSSYLFKKVGTYTVKYYAENPGSKKAKSASMRVIVTDTKAPVMSGVGSILDIELNTVLNLREGIRAQMMSGTDVTSRIQITVKTPSGASVAVPGTQYQFGEAGTYEVVYQAANTSSGKAVVMKADVTVRPEPGAPEISIESGKESVVETGESYAVFQGVAAWQGDQPQEVSAVITGIDAENQPILPEEIPAIGEDGNAVFTKAGEYTIVYTAKSQTNPGETSSMSYTVTVQEPREAVPFGQPQAEEEPVETE